jgi:hypothetical protein
MRILFLSIVLSIAVPSLGIAQEAANCAPGFVTNTCGNSTGCADPNWACCPLPGDTSGNSWQWSDPGCANVQ